MTEATPLTPPVARIEPKTIEQLGRTRVDNYAWLKDDNWQQVMRDPSLLRPTFAHISKPRTPIANSDGADRGACRSASIRKCAGARRRTTLRSVAGWAVGILSPLRDRRAASEVCAHAARRRGPEQVLIDVDAQAQGKTFYKVISAQHSPDHSMLAYAVDEQGSEIYTVYVKDLASGETLASHDRRLHRRFLLVAGRALHLLDLPRRQRPPGENLPPPRARRRRHAGLRRAGRRLLPQRRASESRDFILIQRRHHGSQSEYSPIPASNADSAADALPAPRRRHALHADALGWALVHPHQRRRRGRLQDHDRASPAAPRARNWREFHRARGRPLHPRPRRYEGLSRPRRARERAAAHRHPPSRRRGACDRACGGGLQPRTRGRLRIRHRRRSATSTDRRRRRLQVVRLRHGRAHADAAQDAGNSVRPRSGDYEARPLLRDGERRQARPDHRADEARHAARRLRAALSLRLRLLRHFDSTPISPSAASALSIAAGSTPSRTCAAARRWASAGSWTGAASPRATRFTDFVAVRRRADRRAAMAAPATSSAKAAPPAAC